MSQAIDIKIPPEFWVSSILPEGMLEKWLRPEGSQVKLGEPIADICVESMPHELMAPATGILKTTCKVNCIVDPGFTIGRIEPSHDT
jgi:hypothetical protein